MSFNFDRGLHRLRLFGKKTVRKSVLLGLLGQQQSAARGRNNYSPFKKFFKRKRLSMGNLTVGVQPIFEENLNLFFQIS